MYKLILICTALFAFCDSSILNEVGKETAESEECQLDQDIIDDIAGYAEKANLIMDYFQGPFKGQTWKRMADFVDKFGPRLTGSELLEESIDYMIEKSKENNLENVHTEELPVPYWLRGEESATLIKPRLMKLPMLGIGFSPATPRVGITAEAIVVRSFEELRSHANESIAGKIVVFDQPFTTYGETVQYRNKAASEAFKKGGVAALIRSITPFSIATPHTGDQIYDDDVVKIPAAAITHEDADFMRREQERGHLLLVNLKMLPTLDTKSSRNIIGDLTGSEMPERHVIIAGHIDAWDVGDGSMDDAGGCFISWLAPIVLKEMDMRPKRTLRSILFTAEEQGLFGAIDYEERHRRDSEKLVFLMESDTGTFAPRGLSYEGSKEGECMMKEILKLFTSINATELVLQSPAPDISIWMEKGFPGAGLLNDNGKYFWFHHSHGDTLNVQDSDVMDLNGGFWTAVAYIISDMKYEVPKSGVSLFYNSMFLTLIMFILVFINNIK